jgi:hypothetical protein
LKFEAAAKEVAAQIHVGDKQLDSVDLPEIQIMLKANMNPTTIRDLNVRITAAAMASE